MTEAPSLGRKAFTLLKPLFLLAVGLTMLAWGWRAFAMVEPAPPPSNEDTIRICAPTIGEIIEETIGVGAVSRELGCLVIGVLGMVVTAGSFLTLIVKRDGA